MSSGHDTKGESNMHFNHVDSTKVNVSSLYLSLMLKSPRNPYIVPQDVVERWLKLCIV